MGPLVRQATLADLEDLAALAIELHEVTARGGRGIGRLLLGATDRWALEHGTSDVRVHAWEFDGGPEPFYRAMGFRTVKREMSRPVAGGPLGRAGAG